MRNVILAFAVAVAAVSFVACGANNTGSSAASPATTTDPATTSGPMQGGGTGTENTGAGNSTPGASPAVTQPGGTTVTTSGMDGGKR